MILYARIAAAVVLLGLLFGAIKWVSNTIEKANERDAAVAQVAQVEREKVDLAKTFAAAQADDGKITAELSAFRVDLSSSLRAFNDALTLQPIVHEVQHVENGVTVTCPVRDSVRYRSLYNDAVTGTATAPHP